MQQLWFIDKPITQHVSGTIVPIFGSARLYATAYGFQHLKCCRLCCFSTVGSKNSLYTVHTHCCLNSLYTVHTRCCLNSLYTVHTHCCLNSLYTVHTHCCLNSLYTVHTHCLPASQDSSQHIKCWKPYAVVYSLVLLKMGTVVPETCWVIGFSINHIFCIKLA
jgi:hypothetical protein